MKVLPASRGRKASRGWQCSFFFPRILEFISVTVQMKQWVEVNTFSNFAEFTNKVQTALAEDPNSFTKAFSFNCLKEKSVYKVTKDFSLTSKADSHNSLQVSLKWTNDIFWTAEMDKSFFFLFTYHWHPQLSDMVSTLSTLNWILNYKSKRCGIMAEIGG